MEGALMDWSQLSWLKPSSDIQYVLLLLCVVYLVRLFVSKKTKLRLGGLADEYEEGAADKSAGDVHTCKKEDVLEEILKRIDNLGTDVDELKVQVNSQSQINDERHEMLQTQMNTMINRLDQLYSILLKRS
jgi:2C-methyl-D-erythritol 2,4-cyclodiphosphate synthase